MNGLLISLLASAAWAGPIGNPARTTSSGVVEVQAQIGQSFRPMDLDDSAGCTDNCTALDWTRGPGARLNLRPVDFLGLYGEVGRTTDIMNGTDHAARGVSFSGGGHLAMPGLGPRPALSARASFLETSTVDDEGAAASDNRTFYLEGAALLVLGNADDAGNVWMGPAAGLLVDHTFALYGDDPVSLVYKNRWPVGAVIGAEMVSPPVGQFLRARSPRMSAGIEVRAVDVWAANTWIGVSY